MKIQTYFNKSLFFSILLIFAVSPAAAQTPNFTAPREERLLNGLRLMTWSDTKNEKVFVKVRIHSGASFDPLGKEGVMQMLSEIIFPSESTKEFFRDDLGGNLEIICNYDFIQIDASGDPDKFLTIMETLASALTTPQINKETTERVRGPLAARVKELENDPKYLADRAVAKRLLGNFPYGRSLVGSSDSIAKIDFADLIFAKERFLTADNATLSISGNIKPDYAQKVAKRLFGGWLKADKKVPATFAQPDKPKAGLQIFGWNAPKTSELRFALRGLARNDKDFYASQILETILQDRIKMREGQKAFARHQANLLPGFLILGVSDWNVETVKSVDNKIPLPSGIENYQNEFLKEPISSTEFENARQSLNSRFLKTSTENYWLDSQTFKFISVKDDLQNLQNVNLQQVQRLLEKFQKESAVAVLLVTSEKSNTVTNVPNQ